MNAVDQSSNSQFQNSPLSDYQRNLRGYDVVHPVETEMIQRDLNLTKAKGNAILFSEYAKDVLPDVPSFPTMDEKQQHTNTLRIAKQRANVDKLVNRVAEAKMRLKALKQQEEALNTATMSYPELDRLYKVNTTVDRSIENKSKLITINQEAFFRKQTFIHKLKISIYFILFLMGLGVLYVSGMISRNTFGIGFFIAAIILMLILLLTGGLKKWGDVSIGATKGFVKGLLKAAPVKSCPAACDIRVKMDPKDDVPADYCPPGVVCKNKGVPGKDYKIDRPFELKKWHHELGKHIGPKTYQCAWRDSVDRPVDEPAVITSTIPCHYYYNRESAK